MATTPIYLIDASIYIFRAWFSLPDTLVGKDKQPANAFYGYFDFLTKFIAETKPQHIVVAFDSSGQSFRNEILPAYKANRDPTPQALKRQIALCRLLTRAIGISETAHDNYEADDLIGTLAARARKQGRRAVIVSGDKDLAQLVCKGDTWWDYAKGKPLDYKGVKEKFGVYPEQMADLLAIAGDPSDNIPGARGIGPVTATRLLEHFGSLSELLDNAEKITKIKMRGAERVAKTIASCADELVVSKQLTEINCEVPVGDDFPTTTLKPIKASFESLDSQIGFSARRHRQYAKCLELLDVR